MQSADLHLICTLCGLTSVGKEAALGENTPQVVHEHQMEKKNPNLWNKASQTEIWQNKDKTEAECGSCPFLH